MTSKYAYLCDHESDILEAKSVRVSKPVIDKLREVESRPSVVKMFARIFTSRAFTAKAAHKAFAGVKYK